MDGQPEPTEQQERATLVQLGGCVGCGGLVLLVFALLALTVMRSDRRFTDEPVEVEAALRSIAPSAMVPPGYRGFRAAIAEERRLVQLVPEGYDAKPVPLEEPLTIAVWTFAPGTSLEAARAEVEGYWPKLVEERLGAEAAQVTAEEAVELPAFGGSHRGRRWELRGGSTPLRLVIVVLPRPEGPIALTFVGAAEQFDQPAVDAFLGALR